MIDTQGLGAKLSVLGEAYCLVDCNYLLPTYSRYPNYAQRPRKDFLKPCFELYLVGRQVAFERGEVVVLRIKFTRAKELNANGRFWLAEI